MDIARGVVKIITPEKRIGSHKEGDQEGGKKAKKTHGEAAPSVAETAPYSTVITCDLCGVDCSAHSWCMEAEERDCCGTCYINEGFTGGVEQSMGEPVVKDKGDDDDVDFNRLSREPFFIFIYIHIYVYVYISVYKLGHTLRPLYTMSSRR
jgi:hypothetical protein